MGFVYSRAALALQEQLEKEAKDDAKYRQQLEQERRDHELALRLANESNGQVEDSPPVIRKYVTISTEPLGQILYLRLKWGCVQYIFF